MVSTQFPIGEFRLQEVTENGKKREDQSNERVISSKQKFGSLILTFTRIYSAVWNDKGSGAKKDVAFFHPRPPAGFHSLGTVCIGDFDGDKLTAVFNPGETTVAGFTFGLGYENTASLCVKASEEDPTALKRPVRFEEIWSDKGSGAKEDGSCWRPIPPTGYVALGDVFTNGHSAPSTNSIMCVRENLTKRGTVGNELWRDKGSGAKKDFAAYSITTSQYVLDAEEGLFAVNSFVANTQYSEPTGATTINTLKLPFPVIESEGVTEPSFNSCQKPPSVGKTSVDRKIIVPFTAITDELEDFNWKIKNSPFYIMEREVAYKLILFNKNGSSSESQEMSETITTGISKSQSESFSQSVGVSISVESGVSFLGSGGKVTATVSTELGWESSIEIAEFAEHSVTKTLNVAPNTAAAAWTLAYILRIRRNDNSVVKELPFNSGVSMINKEYSCS